ncbi:MAG: hypothetical protein O7H41_11135 [Planctomycetota bacterium]|nr:hypothetical protein [Planctomycetota bacterium]
MAKRKGREEKQQDAEILLEGIKARVEEGIAGALDGGGLPIEIQREDLIALGALYAGLTPGTALSAEEAVDRAAEIVDLVIERYVEGEGPREGPRPVEENSGEGGTPEEIPPRLEIPDELPEDLH